MSNSDPKTTYDWLKEIPEVIPQQASPATSQLMSQLLQAMNQAPNLGRLQQREEVLTPFVHDIFKAWMQSPDKPDDVDKIDWEIATEALQKRNITRESVQSGKVNVRRMTFDELRELNESYDKPQSMPSQAYAEESRQIDSIEQRIENVESKIDQLDKIESTSKPEASKPETVYDKIRNYKHDDKFEKQHQELKDAFERTKSNLEDLKEDVSAKDQQDDSRMQGRITGTVAGAGVGNQLGLGYGTSAVIGAIANFLNLSGMQTFGAYLGAGMLNKTYQFLNTGMNTVGDDMQRYQENSTTVQNSFLERKLDMERIDARYAERVSASTEAALRTRTMRDRVAAEFSVPFENAYNYGFAGMNFAAAATMNIMEKMMRLGLMTGGGALGNLVAAPLFQDNVDPNKADTNKLVKMIQAIPDVNTEWFKVGSQEKPLEPLK